MRTNALPIRDFYRVRIDVKYDLYNRKGGKKDEEEV